MQKQVTQKPAESPESNAPGTTPIPVTRPPVKRIPSVEVRHDPRPLKTVVHFLNTEHWRNPITTLAADAGCELYFCCAQPETLPEDVGATVVKKTDMEEAVAWIMNCWEFSDAMQVGDEFPVLLIALKSRIEENQFLTERLTGKPLVAA
jgi:hypothetical protein